MTKTYQCISTFDPCYGLNIVRPGQQLVVRQYNYENNYRVIQDHYGPTMGWGWVICYRDLINHFVEVQS